MQQIDKSIQIIVLDNQRLDFKNSRTRVWPFLQDRIKLFSAKQAHLCADQNAANEIIGQAPDNSIFLILDILNPLLDELLIAKMGVRIHRDTKISCLMADGAIPGTAPIAFFRKTKELSRLDKILSRQINFSLERTDTQYKENNQFNLYKYKRLKMFLGLLDLIPDLASIPLNEINRRLITDEVFLPMLGYFTGAKLEFQSSCPHCEGKLNPLRATMSQPFIGYLPATRPYYYECESCRLIVLNPTVAADDISKLYEEFDRQDFVVSHNNPYDGSSARCDFSAISNQLPENAAALDLGGGMGKFSLHIKEKFPRWEVTHSDFSIKQNPALAKQGVKSIALDFVNETISPGSYDIITAWEVIEHVPFKKLRQMFSNIHSALRPGGYFIFSTPDFDSSLCQAFDFYNCCPPFHLTVLSTSWLKKYFSDNLEWSWQPERYCSDFLDDAQMWHEYASNTAPSFQERSLAKVLKNIYASDSGNKIKSDLLRKGMGTEIIVTLRKK